MTDGLTVFLILVAIGVMFLFLTGLAIVAVVLLTQLSGRASGWAELAKRYPAQELPAGQEFTWQTIRVGIVRYRHAARVIVTPQGLGLSLQLKVTKLPPLFIPWEEIKGTQKTRLYGRQAVRLSIGEPPGSKIVVYTKLFEAMSPYLAPGP